MSALVSRSAPRSSRPTAECSTGRKAIKAGSSSAESRRFWTRSLSFSQSSVRKPPNTRTSRSSGAIRSSPSTSIAQEARRSGDALASPQPKGQDLLPPRRRSGRISANTSLSITTAAPSSRAIAPKRSVALIGSLSTSISSKSSPPDMFPRTTARTRSGRVDGLRSASRFNRRDAASGSNRFLSKYIVCLHATQPSRQNPSAANLRNSLSSSSCNLVQVQRLLKFRASWPLNSGLSTPSVKAKISINASAAPYHRVTSAALRGM